MPIKPVLKFFAWSYSRLTDYMKCPLHAKLRHLQKMPEPKGPALDRGNVVHKTAEIYVSTKPKGGKFPEDLKLFKKEFNELRKLDTKMNTEYKWAFDAKWNYLLPPDGWFDKNAWCRMVIDLWFLASPKRMRIIDYKTGKIYPEQMEQLELYAIGAFSVDPRIEEVSCEFWYLDQGEIKLAVYKRADIPALKKKWEKMVRPILADTTFAPKPSNSCRWCHFSAIKGGPCKY